MSHLRLLEGSAPGKTVLHRGFRINAIATAARGDSLGGRRPRATIDQVVQPYRTLDADTRA